MKPDLIILTNSFPNASAKSEDWLNDEIAITSHLYRNIILVPEYYSGEFVKLPGNCMVVDMTDVSQVSLTVVEVFNCLQIVLSDFITYPSKTAFAKSFRYNLSLIKRLHQKAKKIYYTQCHDINANPLVYAYWADNLATTACIIKQTYMPCRVVTRGHGYEIFEEQTKHGVVPFRRYQNKFLTRLFADSKRGLEHLNYQNRINPEINTVSYVGTNDHGLGFFDAGKPFSILTCSHIRGVKRLLLMPEILKHVTFDLVWHVIGDGEELEPLKQKCLSLPPNVKVEWHGYLKNEQIPDFYKQHTVNLFASLSYSEGLPVSMMEAQSFGIPIMSTDVGGCREICNEQTGFLIPKDFDPKSVAEMLNVFRSSPKNTEQFRQACRSNWEREFSAIRNYTRFASEITAL